MSFVWRLVVCFMCLLLRRSFGSSFWKLPVMSSKRSSPRGRRDGSGTRAGSPISSLTALHSEHMNTAEVLHLRPLGVGCEPET